MFVMVIMLVVGGPVCDCGLRSLIPAKIVINLALPNRDRPAETGWHTLEDVVAIIPLWKSGCSRAKRPSWHYF